MNWGEQLREHDIRITPQRQLVIETVERLHHSTSEEILAEVNKSFQGVNLSTIYRALEVLEDAGLVAHTHLGHGAPSYYIVDDSEHIHLVCNVCGQSECIGEGVANELRVQVHSQHGFDVDMGHLSIHGTCRSCSELAQFLKPAQIATAHS